MGTEEIKRDIMTRVDQHRDGIIELAATLIRFPSVNPDLEAHAAGEREV